MLSPSLPNADELLVAGAEAFSDPPILPRQDKPRVSGLCKDAREIAYYMAGVQASDKGAPDAAWTQEQGRMAEELTIKALGQRGIPVISRQVEMPDTLPYTGHPDGQLLFVPDEDVGRMYARAIQAAYARQDVPAVDKMVEALFRDYDASTFWNERVVGFENKHFGRYAYEDILKRGLEESQPEIIAQISLYGYALGWDDCYVAVTSQDASSVRGDMTRNRKNKDKSKIWADGEVNPKLTVFLVDLHPYYESLVPVLMQRARFFQQWAATEANPGNIAWELEPDPEKFPWSYSPYCRQALMDGQGSVVAPGLPWKE